MTLQNYSFLWLNSKKALSGLQGGGREENVESIAAIIFERGRSQITELIIGEAFQPLCSFDLPETAIEPKRIKRVNLSTKGNYIPNSSKNSQTDPRGKALAIN
jgi:hypothetical protein